MAQRWIDVASRREIEAVYRRLKKALWHECIIYQNKKDEEPTVYKDHNGEI